MSIWLPVDVSKICSVDHDQIPHSAMYDLGLHCLLRPVCPILQRMIWVYTVCSGQFVPFCSIWSGSTLFAQASLSHSVVYDLGLHCLLRPVCPILRHMIWVYTVCSDQSVPFCSIWPGYTVCSGLSHSVVYDLGLHCLLRPICPILQHMIWVYTVCSDQSVPFCSVWSGSTLFAQASLSHSAAYDLGLHCLLRPVCPILWHMIWVYTVCSGQSVPFCGVWSGSTLFAQASLSNSAAYDLGLHCLLRPVCPIQQHMIWVYTVCSDVCPIMRCMIWVYTVCSDQSVSFCGIWSGSTLFAQTSLFHSGAYDLGLHCLLRPVCPILQHMIWVYTILWHTIWVYTVCSDQSVPFCGVWSQSTLFAQTSLSHFVAYDLGLYCLPRPVCPILLPMIWVYTVCSDQSVPFCCLLSGSTLFAQTSLSHSAAYYLGLNCLLRPVCPNT